MKNLDEINKDLKAQQILINSRPMDDFEGLSPSEMHHLMYFTFGEQSIIHIRQSISGNVLDQLPFFRICEELLKLVARENKPLKLTPGGRLPRKICKELYDMRFITEDYVESGTVKVFDEEKLPAVACANALLTICGALSNRGNKLRVTKTGKSLLDPKNRQVFFEQILKDFVLKFAWGYNDGYEDIPILAQRGAGFSIFLVKKYGAIKQTKKFYADKYLKAYPGLVGELPDATYSTKEQRFENCYMVRTFHRFLEWFGFVEVERASKWQYAQDLVTKTAVLDAVIEV